MTPVQAMNQKQRIKETVTNLFENIKKGRDTLDRLIKIVEEINTQSEQPDQVI